MPIVYLFSKAIILYTWCQDNVGLILVPLIVLIVFIILTFSISIQTKSIFGLTLIIVSYMQHPIKLHKMKGFTFKYWC